MTNGFLKELMGPFEEPEFQAVFPYRVQVDWQSISLEKLDVMDTWCESNFGKRRSLTHWKDDIGDWTSNYDQFAFVHENHAVIFKMYWL